jgi:hypothetical protein
MKRTEFEHLLPRQGAEIEFACGGAAPFSEDTPAVLHEGRLIYFCLPACKRTFEREPEKFLSGAIPHFDE